MSPAPETMKPANPLAFLDEALDGLRREGLYRHLRLLSGEQKPRARFDGRDVINLSSNNYLG
ncbi:MAG TPA: 8-amino-7-oxononanoate synthase, partial [Candidatus Eisenbacteria bacterium]|nr:8-amino-7-oxononanoate synthase [Candidatus Eisenbacteria bacterium]